MRQLKLKYPKLHKELLEEMEERMYVSKSEIEEAENLDDLGYDSLDQIELIMDAEKILGVSIDDDSVESCDGDLEKLSNKMCELLAKNNKNEQP